MDSSPEGGTKQARQAHQASQYPYLVSSCHWNSRYMTWHGHIANTGDWQLHHHHQRGYQGTTWLLSMALQWRIAVSFQNSMIAKWIAVASIYTLLVLVSHNTKAVMPLKWLTTWSTLHHLCNLTAISLQLLHWHVDFARCLWHWFIL